MKLRVAAAQDAPVFLDRRATTERVLAWIDKAADQGVEFLAFGETFVPGYPFWLSETGGARFNDAQQKEAYRLYLEAAIRRDGPELREIASLCQARGIFAIVGVVERGEGPGSGSVYCSAVPVHPERGILAVHRKLRPTFEERLVWASGDGFGLRSHEFRGVKISVLNCWENWMPQARHALYGDGAELHVALWPGSVQNTRDITRFVAMEGRVFVLSVSGILRRGDIPNDFPLLEQLPDEDWIRDGGSAIAAPDGRWIAEPVAQRVGLVTAEIDLAEVARERQNFDPTGHYSRPDVFDVRVDRRRKQALRFQDDAT